jgi:glycosyltransferase involved in cell wall biosynthesis
VSVTPLSVEKDSRTFKLAATMKRLGYDSTVVEGRRSTSTLATSLPFELHSVRPPEPAPPGVGRGPAESDVIQALRRLVGALLLPVQFLRLWVETARRMPPASLYYVHSYEQFPAVWFKSLRHRVPYVYDAHDMYSVLRHDGRSRPFEVRFEDRIRDAVERLCVRRAAALVTVSDGVADLHERAFGRRPLVARNVHDGRLDEVTTVTVREACGLGSDAFLLAISGNYKRGMAIAELLRALLELPTSVHLALIGAGYEAVGDEVARLGLDARVHRFRPLAPTHVVPFLQSADLAPIIYRSLTPNFAYALPNGFFHAIAAGLPVLYPPELVEIRTIVETRGFGVPIVPSDPVNVATTVARLRDDRTEFLRLRSAAERASLQLTWEHEETVLSPVLRRLVPIAGGE